MTLLSARADAFGVGDLGLRPDRRFQDLDIHLCVLDDAEHAVVQPSRGAVLAAEVVQAVADLPAAGFRGFVRPAFELAQIKHGQSRCALGRLQALDQLIFELIRRQQRATVSPIQQIHAETELEDVRAIAAGVTGHEEPASANAVEAHPTRRCAAALAQVFEERRHLLGKPRHHKVREAAPDHLVLIETADGLRGAGDVGDGSRGIGLDQEIAAGEGEPDETIALEANSVAMGGAAHRIRSSDLWEAIVGKSPRFDSAASSKP